MATSISEIYDYTTYQDAARETCSYEPINGSFLTYPVMGVCGEAGECIEKIKKVYRDCGGEIDPSVRYGLMMEIGDVLWFVSCLCDELELKLNEIDTHDTIDNVKWGRLSLADLAIELAYLSGSIASSSTLGRLNKEVMRHSVKQLFVFIHVLSDRIGVPMATIMRANIVKLSDRVRTGKLSGSGDYR